MQPPKTDNILGGKSVNVKFEFSKRNYSEIIWYIALKVSEIARSPRVEASLCT